MSSDYINLLKKSLVDFRNIGRCEYHPLTQVKPNFKTFLLYPLDRLLRTRNFAITKQLFVQADERMNGYDWPAAALTMIGMKRLDNIEHCIRTLHAEHIPGDLMETGVWRGGAGILMRALLRELQCTGRRVWLADSFCGLPEPDAAKYPADKGNTLYREKILNVPLAEVKQNFESYDLLDEQVVFLEGWFSETLPDAPVQQLALLRLDGDLYESTAVALEALYPKVAPGGFVIVDDYNAFPFCKKAVDDYRQQQGINEPLISVDRECVYWRKR